MDTAHLTGCVAQHCWTKAGSSAQTDPQVPIDHELLQCIGERGSFGYLLADLR